MSSHPRSAHATTLAGSLHIIYRCTRYPLAWSTVHDTLGLCWHTKNPLAFLAEILSLSFRVLSQHARCCLVSIETQIPLSWVKVEFVSLHRAPTSIPLGTFLLWKSLVCISPTHLILADGFTWLVHSAYSTLVSSFLMPKGNLWVSYATKPCK